jgi:hypothetical protein
MPIVYISNDQQQPFYLKEIVTHLFYLNFYLILNFLHFPSNNL